MGKRASGACPGHRREGTSGLGRGSPFLRPRKQAKRRCHHSALLGLTSRTHSFNKYLLSAYLCKALPERADCSPGHAHPPRPAPPRPALPVAAPSALERWFWPDPPPEGRVPRRLRGDGQHPGPDTGHSVSAAAAPPLPPSPLPVHSRRYAQRAQPHLVGFSTSSAKEVPSLHSKVNFLRFSRRPWQQPWPGHEPRHSTHDSGRVVRQMA